MKIFISYRRADSKYVVDRIRERLISAFGQERVFRDIESIPLGTDFSEVLEARTEDCTVMLVVIGPQWLGITDAQGNKRLFDLKDYTRIEVETGLNRQGVLVIPVLVMGMDLKKMPTAQELPPSLVNLASRNGIEVRGDPDFDHDMQRLIDNLNESQGGDDGIHKEIYEPETLYIPAGTFWMGSPDGSEAPSHEKPRHEVTLPAYHIGKNPVTNSQYEVFIRETGRLVSPDMGWEGQKVPSDLENCPVMGVPWDEAKAYCEWLSEKTEHKRKYSLPNEAQWEKACRGSYGFSDSAGLREWTCTLWGEKRNLPDLKYRYPWKDDSRNNLNANGQIRRVVRGARKDETGSGQCNTRSGQIPDDPGLPGARHGFRVVMTV